MSKDNSTFNSSTCSQKLRPPSSISSMSNINNNNQMIDSNINKDFNKTTNNFSLKPLKGSENTIQGLKSLFPNKKINKIDSGFEDKDLSNNRNNRKLVVDDGVSPLMKKDLAKIISQSNYFQKNTQNYIEFKNKIIKKDDSLKKELKPVPIKLIKRENSLKKVK